MRESESRAVHPPTLGARGAWLVLPHVKRYRYPRTATPLFINLRVLVTKISRAALVPTSKCMAVGAHPQPPCGFVISSPGPQLSALLAASCP